MTSIALNRCGFTKCETLVECLTVKPKNRPDPAGARKIAVVVTAVDFDQFSRYSTGTSGHCKRYRATGPHRDGVDVDVTPPTGGPAGHPPNPATLCDRSA